MDVGRRKSNERWIPISNRFADLPNLNSLSTYAASSYHGTSSRKGYPIRADLNRLDEPPSEICARRVHPALTIT
jgi:hypothetical protein